jgi:hypothetical protein
VVLGHAVPPPEHHTLPLLHLVQGHGFGCSHIFMHRTSGKPSHSPTHDLF